MMHRKAPVIFKALFFMNGLLLSHVLISNNRLYEIEKNFIVSARELLESNQAKQKDISVITCEEETSFERKCKCCAAELYYCFDQLVIKEQDNEVQKIKKICVMIDSYVKNNHKFTQIVKLFIHALCLHSQFFFDAFIEVDACQNSYDFFDERTLQDEDVLEEFILIHYDKIQFFLDYLFYAYEKLKRNLGLKKLIIPFEIVRDVKYFHCNQFAACCQELLEAIRVLHVTKTGEKAFYDLILAIEKGFEELPYGARHYIIYKIEHFLDDPAVEVKMKALKSLILQRKEILNNSILDELDFELYEKTLSIFLGKIKKGLSQKYSNEQDHSDVNMISRTKALEQIIFKV